MANVLTPTSVSELQRSLYLQALSHPRGQSHHLYEAIWREDLLQQAYLLCRARNTHAPGVDGKRLIDIATYGARKWLKELEFDLRHLSYRPAPLLRVTRSLSGRDSHEIVVPTIRDEVCMTAAMIVLEPVIAAWFANSAQAGSSSALVAGQETDWKKVLENNQWNLSEHQASGRKDYLSEVPHSTLKLSLALRILDPNMLDLFALWLACPTINDAESEQQRPHVATAASRGIPVDLPITPLLIHLAAPKFQHASKVRSAHQVATAPADPASTSGGNQDLPVTRESLPRLPRWSPWHDLRFRYAMFISLLLHAAIISLQFGEPGYGLPFWGQQGDQHAALTPRVQVTLTTPLVPMQEPHPPPAPPLPLNATTPPPQPTKTAKVKAKRRATTAKPMPVAPLAPVLASPQDRKSKGFQSQVVRQHVAQVLPPRPPPPVKQARQVPSVETSVLTTPEESTWTRPVPSPVPDIPEPITETPTTTEPIADKPIEPPQLELQAQLEIEKAQRAKEQIELQKREQERREKEAAIEQAQRQQAAVAKAAEEARVEAELERQRRAKEVAAAAAAAEVAQAAEAAKAQALAEARARAEAERARQAQEAKAVEEKLKLAQAEAEAQAKAAAERAAALAQQQREERARIEAEKLKLAQAKANEEARLRAEAERLRQVEIERAKEALQERQRNEAIAKREAEKAQQAIEAKQAKEAKEAAERLAKQAQLEAESLARQRAAEAAAQAKKLEAERALAAEQTSTAQAKIAQAAAASAPTATTGGTAASSSSPTASGTRDRGGSAGTGQSLPSGRELAARALDSARNLPIGLLPVTPPEAQTPRRASILGRDPKDIQLAFYGDGWRQKVERIGAMNFPKLSKFLTYDPMVVTVSINSDGTLAGIRIVKSSGHIDLDNAVRRIIEMSAPFAAFPPSLKRNFDVADITRTWVFVGDRPQLSGD